ncbi:MAG: 30S ribosomal protein S16 [Cytophagales bacterium]|nr:30S ribosomal protein S16 [Cytophagales bacterium]
MAVKIRLARRGRKRNAIYNIVVADSKSPRDGRFIEKLGSYNPNTNPATIVLNNESALNWVMNGAQPTDTARTILSHEGVMLKKHLQVGVNKGAITQEQADAKFGEWKVQKDSKAEGAAASIANAKEAAEKARLEAEQKVNEARIAEFKKKEEEAKAAAEAAAAEAAAPAEGEENAEEAATEE